MDRYRAWVGELNEKEIFVGGSSLTDDSKLLSAKNDEIQVLDAPYAETKECLTGYFIVKAKDYDAAVEIARGCPALTHNDTVEVIFHGNCAE